MAWDFSFQVLESRTAAVVGGLGGAEDRNWLAGLINRRQTDRPGTTKNGLGGRANRSSHNGHSFQSLFSSLPARQLIVNLGMKAPPFKPHGWAHSVPRVSVTFSVPFHLHPCSAAVPEREGEVKVRPRLLLLLRKPKRRRRSRPPPPRSPNHRPQPQSPAVIYSARPSSCPELQLPDSTTAFNRSSSAQTGSHRASDE